MNAPKDTGVEMIDPQVLLGITTLRQPTWRSVAQAGLFLTVALIGALLVFGEPPKPDTGWPILLTGLALGIGIPAMTTVGGRRRVDLFEQGFVVHELFVTRRHRWSEVSDFTLATVIPGRSLRQAYVVYDVVGDRGFGTWFNRVLSGRSRSLPTGIEPTDIPGNAVTVALTMNAWRARYLNAEASPAD